MRTREDLQYWFKPIRADWYVLSEVIGPFIGGIIFFIFIFLMFQALRLADYFIIHGVSAVTLGKITLLMALSFLPNALPIAFLIAILVSFGRLSADSELVAMKASGISVNRLAIPVTWLAIIVACLSIGLNMEWVPWGERTFKSILIKVGNTKAVSNIREGTFTSGFYDLLIFVDKVDSKTNRLYRVFLYDEREPKNPLTVVAQDGEILPVKTGSEMGAAALLKLNNGTIHRNDIEENTYQKINFGEYRLYLKNNEGDANAVEKPHMIPYDELKRRIARTTTATYEGREMRGEFWRRYAMAFSPVVFVFLGIGFGTVRTRTVRAGAALIATLILLTYWLIQTTGTVLAVHKGILPPVLAMQLPNILAGIAAFYAFRRATW